MTNFDLNYGLGFLNTPSNDNNNTQGTNSSNPINDIFSGFLPIDYPINSDWLNMDYDIDNLLNNPPESVQKALQPQDPFDLNNKPDIIEDVLNYWDNFWF